VVAVGPEADVSIGPDDKKRDLADAQLVRVQSVLLRDLIGEAINTGMVAANSRIPSKRHQAAAHH
jgi:hypothetical protein